MPDRNLKTAYKAWTEAIENMKAALAANPLLADPLMASAQVFEDVGRMMFRGAAQLRKRGTSRAKSKSTPKRKSTAASARKRKKVSGRGGGTRRPPKGGATR